jgi:hypothetical protein
MKLIVHSTELVLSTQQKTFFIKRQFEEDKEKDWYAINDAINLNFFKDENNEYKAAIRIVDNENSTDILFPLELEVIK